MAAAPEGPTRARWPTARAGAWGGHQSQRQRGREVAGPVRSHMCVPVPWQAGSQAARRLSSLSLTAQLLSSAFLGVVRDKRVNSARPLQSLGAGEGSGLCDGGESTDSRDLDTT